MQGWCGVSREEWHGINRKGLDLESKGMEVEGGLEVNRIKQPPLNRSHHAFQRAAPSAPNLSALSATTYHALLAMLLVSEAPQPPAAPSTPRFAQTAAPGANNGLAWQQGPQHQP